MLKPEAFEREHIPGSINLPEGDEERLREPLFQRQGIVVYCPPTDCHASDSVAEKLTKRGFTGVYDYAAGLRDGNKAGTWKRVCIEAYSFSYRARRIEGRRARVERTLSAYRSRAKPEIPA